MIKLILCLTVALTLASCQENGIIWPQYQYQQPAPQQYQPSVHYHQNTPQYRAADEEEQLLGAPFLPLLPLIPKPAPFFPSLGVANLNMGRMGGMWYGNSLVAASNPMENEEQTQQLPAHYQSYQADPQTSLPQEEEEELGGKKKVYKKKKFEDVSSPIMVQAATPSCAQGYNAYQAPIISYPAPATSYPAPAYQGYELGAPQQTYPAYQPYQQSYQPQYQPQPQNAWYEAKNSQYEAPQQPSSLIVQPSGTYDEADKINDERTWDHDKFHDKEHKKHDKEHGKGDKGHKKDKKDKKQHHLVFYKGIYKVPVEPEHHHEPEHHYEAPPVYTKPAPAYNYEVPQYDNYYNTYRSMGGQAEQAVASSANTEVAKDLVITTTEAATNKSTTTISCISTNEITPTTTLDDKDSTAAPTTTEKTSSKKEKEEKKKPKKTIRRRRSARAGPANTKRCITLQKPFDLDLDLPAFKLPSFPLLGAPNPTVSDEDDSKDLTSNQSEKCESGKCKAGSRKPSQAASVPRTGYTPLNEQQVRQVYEKTVHPTEPYLGAVLDDNKKLWNNNGIIGRFIGPMEDHYLEYVKHQQNMPQLQDIRVIT